MNNKIIRFFLKLVAVVFIFPVAATFLLSFYAENRVSFSGWNDLLFHCFIFYPMFWNSVLYSLLISVGSLFIIIPGAFGLTVLKTKFTKAVSLLYLVVMMMPLQVTLLPNYIGLRNMGLLNTRACIILPMIFSSMGTVLMHQYMKSLDMAQIEAARMETNSVLCILWRIVVPELGPCVRVVFLLMFVESYNMLEQPLLFLDHPKLQTLPVFISNAADYTGDVLFPASVLFMIPVLLLFLFLDEEMLFDDRIGN